MQNYQKYLLLLFVNRQLTQAHFGTEEKFKYHKRVKIDTELYNGAVCIHATRACLTLIANCVT